jgi:hypothetical protein
LLLQSYHGSQSLPRSAGKLLRQAANPPNPATAGLSKEENNMSAQTIKLIIAGALLLHGLGHGGALAALFAHSRGMDTGSWLPARSWLFPSLATRVTTTVASIFWILSLIGFVAAALSFWGVLVPGDVWRQLALTSSIVSALGIVLFFGTWPTFNTLAALGVNVAVLVTQLWLHWPPQAMFGK